MTEAKRLDIWLWRQLGNQNSKIGKASAWQRLSAFRLHKPAQERLKEKNRLGLTKMDETRPRAKFEG